MPSFVRPNLTELLLTLWRWEGTWDSGDRGDKAQSDESDGPEVIQPVWGPLGLNHALHHLLPLEVPACFALWPSLTHSSVSPEFVPHSLVGSGWSLSFRAFLLIWAPLLLTM